MRNRKLVVGLAATFIGLTAVLVVAGIVVHPILIFVSVPFGIAAYLLWLHASGRLADRVRTRRSAGERARGERPPRGGRARGERPPGDGRASEYERTRASARENREAAFGGAAGPRDRRRQSRTGRSGTRAGRREVDATSAGPTRREAARTLGVDPEADQETVRSAYRERAKSLHPDADDGDEAAFKELTRAYDRLRE